MEKISGKSMLCASVINKGVVYPLVIASKYQDWFDIAVDTPGGDIWSGLKIACDTNLDVLPIHCMEVVSCDPQLVMQPSEQPSCRLGLIFNQCHGAHLDLHPGCVELVQGIWVMGDGAEFCLIDKRWGTRRYRWDGIGLGEI